MVIILANITYPPLNPMLMSDKEKTCTISQKQIFDTFRNEIIFSVNLFTLILVILAFHISQRKCFSTDKPGNL